MLVSFIVETIQVTDGHMLVTIDLNIYMFY
jgi:hypothetical protein